MSQIILEISNQEDEALLLSFAKRLNAQIISVEPQAPVKLKDKRWEEMERAARDPLFLADIAEVMNDFKYIDSQWPEPESTISSSKMDKLAGKKEKDVKPTFGVHRSVDKATEIVNPNVDDLTILEGIDAKMEKELNLHSIFTYQELANISPVKAESIRMPDSHRLEDWIEQAKLVVEKRKSGHKIDLSKRLK